MVMATLDIAFFDTQFVIELYCTHPIFVLFHRFLIIFHLQTCLLFVGFIGSGGSCKQIFEYPIYIEAIQ